MSMNATLFAHNDNKNAIFLIEAYARSTSEALAEALGLESAYGITDPDAPSNYLDETVDPSRINWNLLKDLKGCAWENAATPDYIRKLLDEGWTLVYSPSY